MSMTLENNEEFILLIMNCKKYREKAEKQKETWLKQLPSNLTYFHVIGDEELSQEYIFDEEKKILWIRNKDDYVSLPHKVISAYKALLEKYSDIRYIFKTDDDQKMETPSPFFETIMKILREKVPKVHYGGKIVNVDKPYLSKYHTVHPELPDYLPVLATKYCNGRFYFLSKEASIYLVTYQEKISQEYLEDYAIGYYLHETFKKTILKIDNDRYFVDFPEEKIIHT